MGNLSTNGAHTNLKEYPNAAQLKKVILDFFKPASPSQSESDENINRIGIPAEKPRNNILITAGSAIASHASRQLFFGVIETLEPGIKD